jgi:hypothetical protein
MAVVLDDMERQHLIHKEERVGIWTAQGGNRIVADIIEKQYRKQARALLGREMLLLLLERLRVPLPEPVMDTFNREDEISPPSRSP